jgi:peptidyl-prolyl cis-trans isomerase A (cyclophilin A)
MAWTAVVLAGLLAIQSAPVVAPAEAHVVIHTDRGDIALTLDAAHAPVTTCNFLRYVEAGRYGDARFFRTVVRATNANPHPIDVIQAETTGGSDDPGFGPIAPATRASATSPGPSPWRAAGRTARPPASSS